MSTGINRVLIEVWHHSLQSLLKVLSDGTILIQTIITTRSGDAVVVWQVSNDHRADIDMRRAWTTITIEKLKEVKEGAEGQWQEIWQGDI